MRAACDDEMSRISPRPTCLLLKYVHHSLPALMAMGSNPVIWVSSMIQMGFTHSASKPRKCKSWLSAWVLVMYPVNHVTTRFGASDSLRISLRTTDDTGTDERIGSTSY